MSTSGLCPYIRIDAQHAKNQTPETQNYYLGV
jgi:hypothetical protein